LAAGFFEAVFLTAAFLKAFLAAFFAAFLAGAFFAGVAAEALVVTILGVDFFADILILRLGRDKHF